MLGWHPACTQVPESSPKLAMLSPRRIGSGQIAHRPGYFACTCLPLLDSPLDPSRSVDALAYDGRDVGTDPKANQGCGQSWRATIRLDRMSAADRVRPCASTASGRDPSGL